MVVAGEVEDDAGGADEELDVRLLEQLHQRAHQALQVADIVGRVGEVPAGNIYLNNTCTYVRIKKVTFRCIQI